MVSPTKTATSSKFYDHGKQMVTRITLQLATPESRKELRNKALRVVDKVRIGAGLIYLMQDPTSLDRLFKVIDGNDKIKERYPDLISFINDQAYRNSGFKKLYEENYLPPLPDLDILKEFAEGTLGRTFADHLISRGHVASFYPELQIVDAFDYFNMRTRQTHDLLHVLTGFDTDLKGEAGVLAFSYGQISSPLALLLATGTLQIKAFSEMEDLENTFVHIMTGYQAGKAAGFLLDHPLESYWNRPLAEVRILVGLPEQGVV